MGDAINVLSAEDLGISPEELEGLQNIETYLRSSLPVHINNRDGLKDGDLSSGFAKVGFNMGVEACSVKSRQFDCGCAACIGGHLSLHLQGVDVLSGRIVAITSSQVQEAISYVDSRMGDHSLSILFYPPDDQIAYGESWSKITPHTAADAIRNFLTTRNPSWNKAAEANGQGNLVAVDEEW